MSRGLESIVLVDYLDSFSYNIVSELYLMGQKVSVITHTEVDQLLDLDDSKRLIIYGPGPGHPSEYTVSLDLIPKLLDRDNLYHAGICLGHQLLWLCSGMNVVPSANPMHGRSVSMIVPNWSCFTQNSVGKHVQVQRYNSLQVLFDSSLVPTRGALAGAQCHSVDGEFAMASFKRGVSYQFHPESIGTSFRKIFFQPLIDFII